jgi:hypothetical protein
MAIAGGNEEKSAHEQERHTVFDLGPFVRRKLGPARRATRTRARPRARTHERLVRVVDDQLALGGVVCVHDVRDCGIVILCARQDGPGLRARGVDEPAMHELDARLFKELQCAAVTGRAERRRAGEERVEVHALCKRA